MLDPEHPIAKLLKQDKRYRFDAYVFVFEALRYAQEELGYGAEVSGEEIEASAAEAESGGERRAAATRHLTGPELCEAIRQYALEQYGYMAKCVLNQWGVHTTGDFGEIVFNLIDIGEMRKTPSDRREDFDDVFDFEEGLTGQFQIEQPE